VRWVGAVGSTYRLQQYSVVGFGGGTAGGSAAPGKAKQSQALSAVLFFNNWEGKGSSGLDESRLDHRVELYLARAL